MNSPTSPTIDSIPVAKTPPGGWTEWPAPILVGCREARAAGLVTMAKCATPTPAAVASLTRSDPDLASFSRMPGASASTHRIADIRAVIAGLRFGRIGCVWQMEATVPIAARAVDNDLAEVKRRWHGILDRAMDHRTTGASG